MNTHVVVALDVRDPGDVPAGIAATPWTRTFYESHDEAFKAYAAARAAGLEARAEQVRQRIREAAPA